MEEHSNPNQTPVGDSKIPREKIKKGDVGRALRAAARKEKRQSKSEAKKLRKLNVQPSAKWTTERKAEMKLKKIANKPLKTERKRQRLLIRAEKLRKQGAKMLADADKAEAQFYQMTKNKEKEAQQNAANDLENGPAMELIDDEAAESSSDSDSSDSDTPAEDGGAPLDKDVEMVPADEVVLKRRRESDAASVRSAEAEAVKTEPETPKEKKSKKSKKAAEETEIKTEASPANGGFFIDVGKASKEEKKRKRDDQDDEAPPKEKKSKKEKREKKEKKEKKSKKRSVDTADDEDDAEDAEQQWHVGDLSGGEARQEKYLRLLGGGKKTDAGDKKKEKKAGKKALSDPIRAEQDIERQFEAGMKMKIERGGGKKGLGA